LSCPLANQLALNLIYGFQVLCIANVVAVPATPSGGAAAVVVPPSTAIPANPKATAVHTISHVPTAAPTPSSDDDGDLPYCDEL